MTRKKLTPAQVKTRKNVIRTEELISQGCTRPAQIAELLGVSRATARKYIQKVLDGFTAAQEDSMKVRSKRAIARYEQLAYAALQAFARSQENEEELTSSIKEVVCPNCNGTGADNECEVCDGEGKVKTEVISKRVKGKAGDSSFLNVARLCFTDIAKIEGTIQKNGPLNIGILGNDAIDKFKGLSDDEIHRLHKMHQKALLLGRGNQETNTSMGSEKVLDLRRQDDDAPDGSSADRGEDTV